MPVDYPDYHMGGPRHEWTCPKCKKFILAYTEGGIKVLSEEHMDQHFREDREQRDRTEAIQKFRAKNYDVLSLHSEDFAFLRTRGIKIDDHIELDLTAEFKPSKTELDQYRWSEILRRAWPIKN